MSKAKAHVELRGLQQPYHLDLASCLPPFVLQLEAGQSALDMCAAPGGKSLQMAMALNGSGRLVLNELSPQRRQRLKRVVAEHLSESQREIIRVWGQDGSLLGQRSPERFDAILCDAPCSSERHLLDDPVELEKWSEKRSKNLAHRQMALLCSALDLLESGGRLIYSTCSISPLENEQNIAKFLKKRSGLIEETPFDLPEHYPQGEPKTHGRLILPDVCEGHGPMYVVALRKI